MPTTWVMPAALVLVGTLHLVPAMGAFSARALQALYGVDPGQTDLLILLRHRALLFAVLGLLLLAAAFHAPWRLPALVAGFASMSGFIVIAHLAGGHGAAINRIVIADAAGIVVLLIAAGLQVVQSRL